MVKIWETKRNQTLVSIPRAIARAKQLKAGTECEWVIDNLGNLILKPKQT